MVNRIVAAVLQLVKFGAFLFVLFVGGNWDELVNFPLEVRAMQNHTTPSFLIPTIKYDVGTTKFLIANGLVYAVGLLVLILLFEAMRKRLKPWALYTIVEFLLAVVIALTVKGWAIHAV